MTCFCQFSRKNLEWMIESLDQLRCSHENQEIFNISEKKWIWKDVVGTKVGKPCQDVFLFETLYFFLISSPQAFLQFSLIFEISLKKL